MTTSAPLVDSLLSAFPAGSYGLPALLQLSEIVESMEVPTAAVTCARRPRLLINPDFVAKHANTPEKLVMLVMHELHHVILGHTRLYPRATPLDNLVFDAVINSMLCWMMPERATRALFEDFYDHRKFPDCFLRPPPGWDPGHAGRWRTPGALADPEKQALADLHRRLYTAESVGYEELREALAHHVPNDDAVALLGDHQDEGTGSSSDGDLKARSPEFLEQVRRIVERWPQPPTPIVGRSMSTFMASLTVKLPRVSTRHQLANLLRSVAGRKGRAPVRRSLGFDQVIESPLPRLDRRAVVLHGLGQAPLFYRHELPRQNQRKGGEPVHIYVDVSGSMDGVLGPLYRAVLDCEELVAPLVHLFSTKVYDITIARMRSGFCKSTGGTSIECVTSHMAAHRVKRAVVVTDGYVGKPGAEAQAVLEQCRLGVALFGPSVTRADLEGVVDIWIALATESKGGAA